MLDLKTDLRYSDLTAAAVCWPKERQHANSAPGPNTTGLLVEKSLSLPIHSIQDVLCCEHQV